jgi:hypothetical protein
MTVLNADQRPAPSGVAQRRLRSTFELGKTFELGRHSGGVNSGEARACPHMYKHG